MSTEIVSRHPDLQTFTPSEQQLAIIKEQIAPDLTDGELRYFLEVAKARGLNPILNQIYAIKRPTWDPVKRVSVPKMTIQTAIEGYLLIAERTGQFRGCKTWRTGAQADGTLQAHALVHKRDYEPFEVTIDFVEFMQTNKDGQLTGQWRKMPGWMLEKVALARCLNRAFPEQLGGLYTGDEMPDVERAPAEKARVALIPGPATEAEIQADLERLGLRAPKEADPHGPNPWLHVLEGVEVGGIVPPSAGKRLCEVPTDDLRKVKPTSKYFTEADKEAIDAALKDPGRREEALAVHAQMRNAELSFEDDSIPAFS